MQQTGRASLAPRDASRGSQVRSSAIFEWRNNSPTNRSMMMKAVRHLTTRLAWSLTLTVAALLLPPTTARAGQGHGGHAVWGGSGHSLHHGHQGLLAGYGGSWGGFYPYWGYDSFSGGYSGYGGYGGNAASDFYFGGYTPYWGASPFGQSTVIDPGSFMAHFHSEGSQVRFREIPARRMTDTSRSSGGYGCFRRRGGFDASAILSAVRDDGRFLHVCAGWSRRARPRATAERIA